MSPAIELFIVGLPSGRQVVVATQPAVVGSAPDAVVRIEGDPRVKPRHACVRRVGNRWMIEADGDGLIQIGNGSPSRMGWLQPGDVIALTSAGPEIRFELPASAASRPSAAMVPLRDATNQVDASNQAGGALQADRGLGPAAAAVGARWQIQKLLAGGIAVAGLLLGLIASWPRDQAPERRGAPPPSNQPAVAKSSVVPPAQSDVVAPVANASGGPAALPAHRPPAPRDPKSDSGAIVWLGFRFHGDEYADRTGWAIQPDLIVSTAEQVAKLKLLSDAPDHKFEVIAGCGTARIPAIEFRIHPAYNFGDPGSEASLQHNIGLVRLQESLPMTTPCRLASAAELAAVSLHQRLAGRGYINDLDATDPYDPLRVRLETTAAVVSGAVTGAAGSPPLFKVELKTLPGLDGWPAFNGEGRVVGMLVTPVAGPRMVSGILIQKLMESHP